MPSFPTARDHGGTVPGLGLGKPKPMASVLSHAPLRDLHGGLLVLALLVSSTQEWLGRCRGGHPWWGLCEVGAGRGQKGPDQGSCTVCAGVEALEERPGEGRGHAEVRPRGVGGSSAGVGFYFQSSLVSGDPPTDPFPCSPGCGEVWVEGGVSPAGGLGAWWGQGSADPGWSQ